MLTPKQARFCEEYVVDCNGAGAAVRAGYSAHTAKEAAYKLLKQPAIRERIERLQAERGERIGFVVDDVVREYGRIAFAQITDVIRFGPKGVKLRSDSSKLSQRTIAAIAEVHERILPDGKRTVSVKLAPKLEALNALGKHLGMFPDPKLEVKVQSEVEQLLEAVRTRVPKEVYAELLKAVASALGVRELVAPAASGDPGSGPVH